MPDRAALETERILASLDRDLDRLYKVTARDLMEEMDPMLNEIYLDDEEATQRQRLQHAEKSGNLDKLVSIFVAYLLLANEKAIDRINSDMRRVYRTNYSAMRDYIKGLTGVNVGRYSAPNASRATRRAYNRATGETYVSNAVLRELEKGIKKGEGIPKLAKRVQSVSNRSRNNARLVARTEITRYQNSARLDSFDDARRQGLQLDKQWAATADSRTRDSHAAIDGEIVGLDDAFSNGLEYPGDPNGSPAEACNCRCVLVPILKGLSHG